eukprot:NODE_1637_length_1869_cov_47.603093_g1385_i0.p1 GENE.NODE_1637_length_1869_cov_47.603093_g1385_i0~~NODE_1637_length_1869_cov_47.603093_g1385_i0.p1  ORF type:complete len:595 (+),score=56.73 NODE_1637_length_1869_cov_47.603093_g1385_i0:33-1787(+)
MWLFFVVNLFLVYADDTTHKYKDGESVKVWANKVGPFNNPLETYEYFSLPLCRPSEDQLNEKFSTLGEALQGDELVEHTNVKLQFKVTEEKKVICQQIITPNEAKLLHNAIIQQYWYQYYVDDLPMWANLGKVVQINGERTSYIYLHQHFTIGYNKDQIVLANLTVDNEVPIPLEGGQLDFTYSVTWSSSIIPYEHRFWRYLDNQFFEHKIHWFSIINSFMMVMFLVGLVVTILSRTLRADYQRYSRDNNYDEDQELVEDSGWKQVHADVFRVPPHPAIFCALVGTGFQLMLTVFGIIITSLLSVIYASRGALLTMGIVVWAINSYFAGFYSGNLFASFSQISPVFSKQWIRTMLYTALLFPGICFLSVFLMNFVAWGHHSAQAIPFGSMVVMILIWSCVSFPLVVLGTMVGRNVRKAVSDIPRVSQIPRHIPERQWYLQRSVFLVTGGILPFGSIFIELYFIFTSFWNYKFYYVYGFLFLVICILIVVTACVSIVCTYFLLNSEDHRWPWTSFGLSSSIAVYMFIYAFYFFFSKTKMSGLLMTTLYFGYMGLFSFGFGIMTGSVGYTAALLFVQRIYRNVKLD